MQSNTDNAFAYWDGDDHLRIADFVGEWQAAFPAFRVFGNQDVYPLLDKYSPGHVDLFKAMRLPAAKSDIARLLLLYELGGLYIDCHFGLRSRSGIRYFSQARRGTRTDSRGSSSKYSATSNRRILLYQRRYFRSIRMPSSPHVRVSGVGKAGMSQNVRAIVGAY